MNATAREQMTQRMLEVFGIVNTSIDHVPPSIYHFEVGTTY
jgi:hypothetical protein